MSRTAKSRTLYPHPFSKAYWLDAAAELKDIKMLVITALMIALRIALKPFAIYIGPQMAIQTATLATALGAMVFGPVMAIPAAIISDTLPALYAHRNRQHYDLRVVPVPGKAQCHPRDHCKIFDLLCGECCAAAVDLCMAVYLYGQP